MKSKIIETFGWYGVVAIVGAYAALSLGMLSSGSLLYQVLNLTGSVAIVVDALKDGNKQPAVLNIIWALIALLAIVQTILG